MLVVVLQLTSGKIYFFFLEMLVMQHNARDMIQEVIDGKDVKKEVRAAVGGPRWKRSSKTCLNRREKKQDVFW